MHVQHDFVSVPIKVYMDLCNNNYNEAIHLREGKGVGVSERLEVGKGREGGCNYIVISKTKKRVFILTNRH